MSERPADETARQTAWLARLFDDALRRTTARNVFVYHTDLPPDEGIAYRDVAIKPQRFDYRAVLEHFIERMRRFLPDATLVLATCPDSAYSALAAEDVTVVELPVDVTSPMYSRALAMYAYAMSRAFCADTLFADSDAFPNAPLDTLFALRFDIALTYRALPGLMPVNEGVILVRAARPAAVRDFFARFVATYDRLLSDSRVLAHYGDVKRWRGGQLALNALVHGLAPFSPYRVDRVGDAVVRFLPCDTFNFSWDYAQDPRRARFDGRYIVHLKGGRKEALQLLRDAMQEPARASVAPARIDERTYSLDTTPPVDYEPEQPLDYERATLTQIADHFKTDKGSVKHRYTEIYEHYLGGWRGRPVELLEIGVACGSSLKAWARWLGPEARVTGIDIRPACANLCRAYPNIEIVIADATEWNTDRLFDVVIDDGSHVSLDIVTAFDRLWRRVRPGGCYAIEDLRCTHDPRYAEGFSFPKAPAAFRREHFMTWLDRLLRGLDENSRDVEYVHFYSQLVVIRKR